MPNPYLPMPAPLYRKNPYSLAPDAPPVDEGSVPQLFNTAPPSTPQVSISTPPAQPGTAPNMQADLGNRLMAALQPRPISTGRKVLGGILGAFGGPELGALASGELGRQQQVQNLGQQYGLAGQIAQQNRQQTLDASTLGLQRAQIGNLDSESQARLNPPIKQGLTPEETALHDLMTGNGGQPRVNPDTGKPYQYLEAFNAVNIAKTGAAKPDKPGEYKPYTVPGATAPMLATQVGSKLIDRTGKELPANAVPFEKPPEAQKPPQTAMLVPVDPSDPSKGSRVINATPGTIVPQGAKTASELGAETKISVAEQNRADLAENMNENLDKLEDIVKRRPELFGPIAGRETKAKIAIGTGDTDAGALGTILDNFGKASSGAHQQRGAESVARTADALVNSYKNQPGAILSAIQDARDSVKTFTKDVTSKGGSTGSSASTAAPAAAPNVIRYDINGNRIK